MVLRAAEETRAGTVGWGRRGRNCGLGDILQWEASWALRVGGDEGMHHDAILAGGDNGWHRRKGETTAGIVGTLG